MPPAASPPDSSPDPDHVLNEIAQLLSSTLDFPQLLTSVLRLACQLVQADAGALALVTDDGAAITYPYLYNLPSGAAASAPRGRGLAWRIVETGESLLVADYAHYPEAQPAWVAAGVHAFLGAPVMTAGERIGALGLFALNPHRRFTERDAVSLSTVGRQAGLAILNARLHEAVRQRADRLALINDLSASINQHLDLDNLLQAAVDGLARALRVDQAGLALLDDRREQLTLRADHPAPGGVSIIGVTIPVAGNPSMEHVLATRSSLAVRDAQNDPRLASVHALMRRRGVYSLLIVPLSFQGEIIGTIGFDALAAPRDFSRDEVALAETVANLVTVRIKQAQLLEAERRARQLAESVSRLKTEFLANTSHELRTPLTGLLGALNMVLTGLAESPDEERHFLELAYNSGRGLLATINRLLELSEIEAGQLELRLGAVGIAEVLGEVYSLLQPELRRKNLSFRLDGLDTDTPPVRADAAMTRQILLNVIGNAVKFTEQGGVVIGLRVDDARQCLEVSVADTGIGIAPEQQPRLFQPFVQADGSSTRRYGGAGLGLAISRQLTELMGGTLSLESNGLGQGSRARLTLPLARP